MTVSTSAATAAHVASVKSTICVRLLIAAMRRDMHAERQCWCRLVDRRKRLSHVAGRRLALLWGRRFRLPTASFRATTVGECYTPPVAKGYTVRLSDT